MPCLQGRRNCEGADSRRAWSYVNRRGILASCQRSLRAPPRHGVRTRSRARETFLWRGARARRAGTAEIRLRETRSFLPIADSRFSLNRAKMPDHRPPPTGMVRRGSTVRVRQRALQKPRNRAFCLARTCTSSSAQLVWSPSWSLRVRTFE